MKPFKVPGIHFSWRHDGQDHPPRDPYRSDWRVHHPPPPWQNQSEIKKIKALTHSTCFWSSTVLLRKRKSLICLFIFIFLAIQLRTILMECHLQPFLKSAVMCNICLFNVHLKQYSMQTGKYKDTYNLLRSDYIYLILSLLGRWTKFFKTRPQAPGPHLTSPVASPAARWPAVPVSPTGLIWSTT